MADYRFRAAVGGCLTAAWHYSGVVSAASPEQARALARELVDSAQLVPHDCELGKTVVYPVADTDLIVESTAGPADDAHDPAAYYGGLDMTNTGR